MISPIDFSEVLELGVFYIKSSEINPLVGVPLRR